ncbi:MAG: RNA binding S1 protein [uncultured bacterium]|nr:MAG: RNA binding S1 protein [uncultured bacterium]KKT02755.1 MAG: RNA binding S1 domain-containing protein, small subunit ribosomal protein S1 [Candidatus Peregrinibacteria bacterium GW2011_GWF2_43_17]HAU39736.1 30S ribosomal protein S1 [Candidatus Peregrinibacteria bacterium]
MADTKVTLMEELLMDSPEIIKLIPGKLVEGTIISLSKSRIMIDIGGITTGIIAGKEVKDSQETIKSIQVGDTISAAVLEPENEEGYVVLSLRKASQEKSWQRFLDAFENDKIIQVKPNEANKGGLLLEIDGIKGFIPVSQLAPLHYPRVNGADSSMILQKLQKLIGQNFDCKVIGIDKENGKLILSEKAAQSAQRSVAMSKLKIGQKVKGRISGVVKFGIFVAFDGLEGLVHISEIAWGHVSDPLDYGKVGDELEVLVIGMEADKISLSMKRLVPDPWIDAAKKFKVGNIVEGEVTRVAQFGAFMKLNDEINGLIHISEMPTEGDLSPANLAAGQKVKARIIDVNLDEHRIGLTLSLEKKEEAKSEEVAEEKEEKKEKKTKKAKKDE